MKKPKAEKKHWYGYPIGFPPKTPHEEIMLCIESTNAIVSKILEMLQEWKFASVRMNVDLTKLMELVKKE